MTGKKQFELDINLSGKVDNSVASALNMTAAQLGQFQSKINQINKLSQQVNLNANGIGALPSKLKEANVQASRMQDIGKTSLRLRPVSPLAAPSLKASKRW